SKQLGFGGKIVIHRAVEVEVVLREVGEDRDIYRQAPDTFLFERMRAHLHHGLRAPCLHTLSEDRVDIAAFGSRVFRWADLSRDVGLDRAQQYAFAANASEELFEEKGRRRLAVGSSHGAEFEFALRMAEDRGADLGQGAATVLNQCDGQIRMGALESVEDLG